MDQQALIRVGLTNANLSFHQHHPIILPDSNKLTKLIILSYVFILYLNLK